MAAKRDKNFHVIDHPLLHHKLGHMRKPVTESPSRLFVQLMREVGMIMACEATRGLHTEEKDVDSEREGTKVKIKYFPEKKPAIIPILRSGLVMAEGVREIISTTYTGHIGIYHEIGGEVKDYLVAIPADNIPDNDSASTEQKKERRKIFLVDPVIVSGATACRAIEILKENNIMEDDITFITLIVGTDGKKLLQREHPDVQVYTAVLDEEVAYDDLVPGLGIISNRLFRTA